MYALEEADALATRAIGHVSLDNPLDVAFLLFVLTEAGAREQADVLAARAPGLLRALKDSERQAAANLAARAADNISLLDDPHDVALALDLMQGVLGQKFAAALATRAAPHVSLDNPYAVAELLDTLRRMGAQQQADALAARAAAHVQRVPGELEPHVPHHRQLHL